MTMGKLSFYDLICASPVEELNEINRDDNMININNVRHHG